jgi:hypothetical protein
MKRILWLTAGAMLAGSCALAQEHELADKTKAELETLIAHSKMIGREGMALSSPVVGAPYAAEEVTKFTQTLGDGTRIQREDKVAVYRDGQGRVRRESPNEITIMDSAAGVGYLLDPKAMTARKISVSVIRRLGAAEGELLNGALAKAEAERVAIQMKADAGSRPPNAPIQHQGSVLIQRHETGSADPKVHAATESTVAHAKAEASGPNPNVVFFSTQKEMVQRHASPAESLGQQSIEGVMSEGTRGTETIPAGAIGNDRPIQVVTERWYSPELKTVTLTRRSDPRSGEEIFRLANVRRGEPSPDLFQLPAGYRVVGQ